MSDVLTLHACATLVKSNVKPEAGGQRKYIGLEHIEQGTLRLSGTGLESDVASTKAAFDKGDVLFGKLRPYFRKVVYAPFAGVCSTDIWVLRAKPGVDQRFLYYWVASQEFVDYAVQGSDGTRMPRANWSQASKHSIPFQTEYEQKAIAHILGTLDDKIDQLRKTNSVLEDMASALFKSWFIDFDPVKAKQENRPTGLPKDLDDLFPDSFEDSTLGPIPTGWRVGCVGDVCHIHDSRRKPLSSIERQAMQGGFPYYGAASVLDYVNSYRFDGIYLLLGEDGSVVQKDGTPVLQYVWDKFWVSNHAHVLTGKGISTEHLLIALRSINISPFVTGAVQPKVSQGNMKSIPLVLPDDRIANELDRLIIPNYDTYRVNTHLIRTLTNLRDTLLPKLISGDLRVPEAEQMVAELGL